MDSEVYDEIRDIRRNLDEVMTRDEYERTLANVVSRLENVEDHAKGRGHAARRSDHEKLEERVHYLEDENVSLRGVVADMQRLIHMHTRMIDELCVYCELDPFAP